MLGLNNARVNQLEAENRRLAAELELANARANALRTALIAAWREHGVERTTPEENAANAVTGRGALARLCWN